MTAHVNVRNYGRDTHTICDTCGLDDQYARHKPAAAAAHAHNETHHHKEPK